MLVNREVIFTQDVIDIFGERPWKSRTDEILALDPRNQPQDVEATEIPATDESKSGDTAQAEPAKATESEGAAQQPEEDNKG
ncbi:MAG: hypothetical protein K2M00_08895 [Muribaculaceae bacterium]|nr:hypothetical protein [Muribaculaceae bacterium]